MLYPPRECAYEGKVGGGAKGEGVQFLAKHLKSYKLRGGRGVCVQTPWAHSVSTSMTVGHWDS